MDKGITSRILTPFLEGMEGEGAEVELFYTRKLKINPCLGCVGCWFETPGVCVQKDDMQLLLPKFKAADVWVYATPLYIGGVSGPMKNMMDRFLPMALPFFELQDGDTTHPAREPVASRKSVLISSCGFWGLDNFKLLLAHFQNMRGFAGALLRPHSAAMRILPEENYADILQAAGEAGRQLVRDGAMSSETLSTVSREIMPLKEYIETLNREFKEILKSGWRGVIGY